MIPMTGGEALQRSWKAIVLVIVVGDLSRARLRGLNGLLALKSKLVGVKTVSHLVSLLVLVRRSIRVKLRSPYQPCCNCA